MTTAFGDRVGVGMGVVQGVVLRAEGPLVGGDLEGAEGSISGAGGVEVGVGVSQEECDPLEGAGLELNGRRPVQESRDLLPV